MTAETSAKDFARALENALRAGHTPTQGDLTTLSGASREEADLFDERVRQATPELRQALFEVMVRAAEDSFELDFVDLFRRFLNHTDAVVRRLAVEGLWEDERPDLVRPLVRLLRDDTDAPVRAAAALALGRFLFLAECEELDSRYAEQIEAGLRAAAEDETEDLEVRRRAIESVAYINEPWVQRLIDAAYSHSDPRMRQSAVFAMGRNAELIWAETVLGELHSDEAAMRYEAARSSGEMQLRRAVEPLLRLLGDSDGEVQEMAIWALGQIGGQKARRALEACVAQGSEAVAVAASEALDEMEFANRPMELLVHTPEELSLEDYGETDADEDEEEDEDDDVEWDEPLDLR